MEIHPQYDGYHGQDINQADVVLMQWPFHDVMTDPKVAANDRAYGNFDIVWDHLTRSLRVYATLHTPCDVFCLVPGLTG